MTHDTTARPAVQAAPGTAGTWAESGQVAEQVAVFSQSGEVISLPVARTIAAQWQSPRSTLAAFASNGIVSHWLAGAARDELWYANTDALRAELEALIAFARHHSGYGYETVIFLDSDDFNEADAAADAHESSWVDGMLDHLMQWEHGDGVERHVSPPWGYHDTEYVRDGYVLAVNHGLAYVSLNRIITEPWEE